MTTVEVFAPAKINLTLHVTGQREDGYHLLDSLVAFAHLGDTIEAEQADDLSLDLQGRFAKGLPTDESNLVLKAARLVGQGRGAKITLTKRLPVSSGIGGGSADAAATVRALCELWQVPWPSETDLLELGSDVPVCLRSGLARMSGIGEQLEHFGATPEMSMILVNPGVSVPTPTVFTDLASKNNPGMGPVLKIPDSRLSGEDWMIGFDYWIDWLTRQRNDLEAPAIRAFPVIGEVLSELRGLEGCRLARMSGSGATCFALFEDDRYCFAGEIQKRHPDWWVEETFNCPFFFDENAPGGISNVDWPLSK